jgi:hypothetical protein
MSAPIFLASGNRMKRVMWKGPGGTWGDLAALHKKGARGETRADARIVARASSPFPVVRRSFSRWLVGFGREENLRIRPSRRTRRATARAEDPRRAIDPGVSSHARASSSASLTPSFPHRRRLPFAASSVPIDALLVSHAAFS